MFFRKISWRIKKPDRAAHVRTSQKIAIDGRELNFTLVQSRLARRVTLKMSSGKGLEIVLPHRYNLNRVPKILHEKQDWIFRNLEKILEQQKKRQPFEDGMRIPILGEVKILRLAESGDSKSMGTRSGRKNSARETGEEIILMIRGLPLRSKKTPGISVFHAAAKKTLELYLRQKMMRYLLQRTPELGRLMKTSFGRITVRGQKSRWGSCSRRNNLSFNWRLIFMPLAVIEYVIIHELAHTVHHNHSKKFYGLVERFCPQYKALRKVLRNREHHGII